jgi:hypothetical protein
VKYGRREEEFFLKRVFGAFKYLKREKGKRSCCKKSGRWDRERFWGRG